MKLKSASIIRRCKMKTGLFALHFRVSFVGARLIESVFLQVRFRLSDFRHGASIEDVFFVCVSFLSVHRFIAVGMEELKICSYHTHFRQSLGGYGKFSNRGGESKLGRLVVYMYNHRNGCCLYGAIDAYSDDVWKSRCICM